MKGTGIKVSQPMVSFKETVTSTSEVALAKSPNHHNRMYAVARPLESGLSEAIEDSIIGPKDDVKERGTILVQKYQWDATEARKIWAFGPDTNGPNILVDTTRAIQYMAEIKDNVVAGFGWVTRQGVLAQEQMRGVRFALVDAVLHSDTVHRGGGQIIPAARRVFYAAQLMAKPRLMEPIFLVDIQCPLEAQNGVYGVS